MQRRSRTSRTVERYLMVVDTHTPRNRMSVAIRSIESDIAARVVIWFNIKLAVAEAVSTTHDAGLAVQLPVIQRHVVVVG